MHYALLISLLCGTIPALAIDTLDVGQGGRLGRWDSLVEEAKFLGVASDSIWMWPAEPGENLSLRLAERGGVAVGLVAGLAGTRRVPLGTLLYDGNASTAFDPDQFDAINRSTPVEIDLGAVFRVDRVRLFPRLDRQNRRRFLQVFRLLTKAEHQAEYEPAIRFLPSTPNDEPVVERSIDSRDVRYVLIEPSTEREWELAEVEIYGAANAPVGIYISRPFRARSNNIIWGKVRYEGGSIENAPAVVQTRTGLDRDPEHYFRLDLLAADGLQRVSREDYQALPEEEKGPIKPNPLWSSWQTVTGGIMRSPGLRRFVQFKVRMASPGTVLRRLVFEFARPPVVGSLLAEISPGVVRPGVETRFTLSMEVHLLGPRGRNLQATGFRFSKCGQPRRSRKSSGFSSMTRRLPFPPPTNRAKALTSTCGGTSSRREPLCRSSFAAQCSAITRALRCGPWTAEATKRHTKSLTSAMWIPRWKEPT